jgi:hypothetical protein
MLFTLTDWTNVGMLLVTVVLAAITAMYVVVTLWLYRSQTDPDVVVFATGDEDEQTLIWLVVENLGKSVASEVTFRWSSPPMWAYGLSLESADMPTPFVGPLVSGIRSLGPGSRRVFVWGQYGGIAKALSSVPNGELSVTCGFTGGDRRFLGDRRIHRREFVIDLKSFDETISRDAPARKLHRETERIAKALTTIASLASRQDARAQARAQRRSSAMRQAVSSAEPSTTKPRTEDRETDLVDEHSSRQAQGPK